MTSAPRSAHEKLGSKSRTPITQETDIRNMASDDSDCSNAVAAVYVYVKLLSRVG